LIHVDQPLRGHLVRRADGGVVDVAYLRGAHHLIDAADLEIDHQVFVKQVLRGEIPGLVADGLGHLPEERGLVHGGEIGVRREPRPEHHAGAVGARGLGRHLEQPEAVGDDVVEEA
jgi:hypothetical protein